MGFAEVEEVVMAHLQEKSSSLVLCHLPQPPVDFGRENVQGSLRNIPCSPPRYGKTPKKVKYIPREVSSPPEEVRYGSREV